MSLSSLRVKARASLLILRAGDLIGLAGGISASELYKVQDGSNTVIGTFGRVIC